MVVYTVWLKFTFVLRILSSVDTTNPQFPPNKIHYHIYAVDQDFGPFFLKFSSYGAANHF